MAPHDDDSRCGTDRPEDNPFIAFRRFTDSQVSQLLNMVLTLPGTMNRSNSLNQRAHFRCLTGQADAEKCRKFLHTEEKIEDAMDDMDDMKEDVMEMDMRDGGKSDMWRRLMNEKCKELKRLDREANLLRQEILEDAPRDSASKVGADSSRELVEKVASRKGEEWAAEWDWDIPTPEQQNKMRQFMARQEQGSANGSHNQSPVWRHGEALLNELGHMFAKEIERFMFTLGPGTQNQRIPAHSLRSYSPLVLEEDDQLKDAGMLWRDAFEDLLRVEAGADLMPREQLGQSTRIPPNQWVQRLRGFNPRLNAGEQRRKQPNNLSVASDEKSEEPSYEYGHDHEDQHDEPPSPTASQAKFTKGMPPTELDAYEQMLGSSSSAGPTANGSQPSVFTTLTTTERTMLPDGTVTTKVVLKKRFSDGTEETSETVHTQHGQEDAHMIQTPFQQRNSAREGQLNGQADTTRQNGWFWSE